MVNIPITFFVRDGPNEWKQLGLYSVKRWGEISPKHLNLMPPTTITVWVNGALSSDWGKKWVEGVNKEIMEEAQESGRAPRLIEYTDEGMRAALADGRLVISFTIMECVGFRHDWHDQLLHFQKHPKPSKANGKRKCAIAQQAGRGSKLSKGARRAVEHESDADNLGSGDDDNGGGSPGDAESSEDEGSRRIAKLPVKRSSKRTPRA